MMCHLLKIYILCITIGKVVALAIATNTLFRVSNGVRKDGNVLMTQQSDTALSCAILCNEDAQCKSANFGHDATNGDFTCELMDAESGSLRRGGNWQYMGK